MTEIEMVDKALQYWKSQGVPAWIEIGCFNNSIDVVLKKDGYIEAIEFKLQDWKTAIKQAVHHKIAVDKSYICLPHYLAKKTLEKSVKMSEDCGVGVYIWNHKGVRVELAAPTENDVLWRVGKDWLADNLHKKSDLKWVGHEEMKTIKLFGGGENDT